MKPLLECRALTKKYGSFFALTDFNLRLERGQIIGLLGPNGSGKTTLIKLINGLLVPSGGEVRINGTAPGPESKQRISYLSEHNSLNSHLRVSEVLDYYTDFYEDFDIRRAQDMLTALGIDRRSRLGTLSKGAKEKVQLVFVMSRNADLYILDEPIGGVDPAARDFILHTILTNYNENSSVLISTHLISDVENILDRVLFLKNGRLILDETVDDLRSKYGKSVDILFREVFKC